MPVVDEDGQIEHLSRTMRRSFWGNPSDFSDRRGAWDRYLPVMLDRSGPRCTLLDDDIFLGSGIQEADMFKTAADIWQLQIRTFSQSESGYANNLQGIAYSKCMKLA